MNISNAYLDGFCKVAEDAGIHPGALMKSALDGTPPLLNEVKSGRKATPFWSAITNRLAQLRGLPPGQQGTALGTMARGLLDRGVEAYNAQNRKATELLGAAREAYGAGTNKSVKVDNTAQYRLGQAGAALGDMVGTDLDRRTESPRGLPYLRIDGSLSERMGRYVGRDDFDELVARFSDYGPFRSAGAGSLPVAHSNAVDYATQGIPNRTADPDILEAVNKRYAERMAQRGFPVEKNTRPW